MKAKLNLTVNGRAHELLVDTRAALVEVLRDELRFTGTHLGCGTGSCGACTVMVNGETMKSCCLLALDVDHAEVVTIEGLADGDRLHPVQQAFADHQGLQCGFCTPGMILSAVQLLAANPDPPEAEIRHAISGNYCRCTGYHFIVESIRAASAALRKQEQKA